MVKVMRCPAVRPRAPRLRFRFVRFARFVRLALGVLAIAPAVAASEVPISAFLDQPQVGLVSIAPSGEHIAVALRSDGKARFRVMTYPAWEEKYDLFLGERRNVCQVWWIHDEFVLVSLGRKLSRLDANACTGELRSIDLKTEKIRILPAGGVIDTLPDDDEHVLVSGAVGRFGLANRLNVYTGHIQRMAQSANAGGWFRTNSEGDVVFTIGQTSEQQTEVHHRRKRERWRLVASNPFGGQGWRPAWPGPRPGTFLTWDNRGDPSTVGLGLYDVASDKHKMIIRHPKADVSAFMPDFNGRPYAVIFDHHFPAVQYLDRKHPLAQQHIGVSKAYPDDLVTFSSVSRDHSKAVALVSGDRNPGEVVLADFKAKRVEPLVVLKPSLPREALSAMRPVELATRDGATIYGYVTSNAKAETPGPLVVLVHGGPYGVRDSWGFNSAVQLLANRGFHVLQVNYRGSMGYGKDYERAGYGQWGRLMQDDVTDATRWAIQSKIADPARVCIMGGSYGAYAALMGAAREPDLYRCAVGGAGVYDLTLLEKRGDIRRRLAGVHYIREVIGDDDDELEARSPSHQAHRIRAAVMLYHGGRDPRTPVAHGHAMRDALERAGNPAEWLFESAQGHGFAGDSGRAELYERILAFLHKHIGRSPQPGEREGPAPRKKKPSAGEREGPSPAETPPA